jgi:c-di-GMP-binding flagellar brake protein YcgR
LEISKDDRQFDIVKSAEGMSRIIEDLILIGTDAKIGVKLDSNSFVEGQFKRSSDLKRISSFSIKFEDEKHCMNFEVEKEFTFFFNLFASFYIFRTIVIKNTGNEIEVAIPEFFVKLIRRDTERIRFSEDDPVYISIKNPLSPGEAMRKPIHDINEKGFSIIVDRGEFVFPVGTSLHEMEIELPNKDTMKTFGRLVHIQSWQDENSYKCGITFFEKDKQKLKEISDFVFFKRFPLCFPIEKKHYAGIWNLFDKSGYLDEKSRESFELVREDSNPTWEKMDKSKGEIARNIATTDGEKITGSMHLSRIYRDTFLLHHFCIYPGYQRTVTTSVYGGMIDQLLESGAKYIACYYNADKAWNDKNYGEFIKNYPYPENY